MKLLQLWSQDWKFSSSSFSEDRNFYNFDPKIKSLLFHRSQKIESANNSDQSCKKFQSSEIRPSDQNPIITITGIASGSMSTIQVLDYLYLG